MPAACHRTATIGTQFADDNTIELAISSEAPYERWFGIEVLRHTADAVDLSRLADGRHPLLLNHDTERQIGVLDRAWIGDDARLRGVARFSRGPLGQEIKTDVQDGIRTLVSVGYFIDEIEEQKRDAAGELRTVRTLTGDDFEREMRALHGDTWNRSGPAAQRAQGADPAVFVVTRWTPFEASIVPVPADASVGVGRAAVAAPAPAPVAATTSAPAAPSLITLEHKTMEAQVKSAAELEIERRDAIIALGTQYAKYLGPNDVADWTRGGKSVEAFRDYIIQKIETRHTDTSALDVGMSRAEAKRYSLGRAIRAAVTGDWREAGLERECSEAVAQIMGRGPEGFFIPPDIFRRDFNVGTSSEAGNLVATDLRGDLYVDALRNATVLGGLGIRILGGLSSTIDLPRKSGVSTIGSATEIGSASETSPTTAKVTLSPKRLTAYVETSKQAIIQAAMSIEGMIRDDLLMGAAVQAEYNCINGTGTAPQPTGIRYTSGIGTTTAGTNGAAVSWGNFVDLESACANSNAEPDRLAGYLTNTKVRGKAKQVQKGTNLPFIWDNGMQPLNGYRCAVTNNMPSNLTKGTSTTVCSATIFSSDWSMGVLAVFGAPDITVDPYSKADTGQVKIVLNQFMDFGIRQPAAFAKIEDQLTT